MFSVLFFKILDKKNNQWVSMITFTKCRIRLYGVILSLFISTFIKFWPLYPNFILLKSDEVIPEAMPFSYQNISPFSRL